MAEKSSAVILQVLVSIFTVLQAALAVFVSYMKQKLLL